MNEQKEQPPLSSNELHYLFTRLNPLDVEQFYTTYQLWITQQRIQSLQAQLDTLVYALDENTQRLEQAHPPALALAALARLQSNGVSDVDILDRMLERGEEWLDRTMQHLDYCEHIDVISGDYTKWCEHALEGAYDWIDSMQEVNAASSTAIETDANTDNALIDDKGTAETGETEAANDNSELSPEQQPLDEATEEMFLQKLMSDEGNESSERFESVEGFSAGESQERVDEQDTDIEALMLETTLKIATTPVPQSPTPQETPSIPDEETDETQPVESTEVEMIERDTTPEAVESTPVLAETRASQANLDMLMSLEKVEQPEPPHLNGSGLVAQASDETVNEAPHLAAIPPEHVVLPEEPAKQAEQAQEELFEDTELPEPLPPKKGVWRTLVATLFHI